MITRLMYNKEGYRIYPTADERGNLMEEILVAAAFYITCVLTVVFTALQMRKATRVKRILASIVLFAAGFIALNCQRNFIRFNYFILGGLLFSLTGVILLGTRKSNALRMIGAITFIGVNILYFFAFKNNIADEFDAGLYNIVFFAGLVVFLDFGGLAFLSGEKAFALKNLLLLPNVIAASATASLGVSLGIRYLNTDSYSITLGVLLVLGCALFAYANLAVCKSFIKNDRYDLNSKKARFEKLAVPAYYIGQLLLVCAMLFVRIGRQ